MAYRKMFTVTNPMICSVYQRVLFSGQETIKMLLYSYRNFHEHKLSSEHRGLTQLACELCHRN